MQIFTWQRLGLATLMLLFVSISLQAQEKISPVTVTQRSTAKDGTKKVVKKRFDDQQALQKYLNEINGQSGNIQIEVESSTRQTGGIEIVNGDKSMIYIRRQSDQHTEHEHEHEMREWKEKLQENLKEVAI